METKLEKKSWKSESGREYWLHVTYPNKEIKIEGTILIFHGVSEHGGCFDDLAKKLSERGIVVYIPDRNGHGKTLKVEEDAITYQGVTNEEEQEDIMCLMKEIKTNHPNTPFILLGHSAGSILALYTAVYQDVGSAFPIILSGFPGILTPKLLIPAKIIYSSCGSDAEAEKRRSTARMFNALSIDKFNKSYRKEGLSSWVTSYPEGLQRYREDPCCGQTVKSEFAHHMTDQMLFIHRNLARATRLKIITVCGDRDPCCLFGKAVSIFRGQLRKARAKLAAKGESEGLRLDPSGLVSICFEARHALHMESPAVVDEVARNVCAQFVKGKTLESLDLEREQEKEDNGLEGSDSQ